jgi:hypothetical protein
LSGQLSAIGFASVMMVDPISLPSEIRTDPREAA